MDIVVSTVTKATLVLVALAMMKRYWKRRLLPPGPVGLPFVGNTHQLPKGKLWVGLSEWAKVYGVIFHLDILGTPYIVVSSARVAHELLDKRSIIYSGRSYMASLHYGIVLCRAGFDRSLSLKPYRNDTSRFKEEIQLTIGKIIMRVTYGYTVTSLEDPIMVNALKSIDNFSKGSVPGTFAVDIIPALRYLPKWFPGTGFFKVAKEWKQLITDATTEPFNWAKEHLVTGKSLLPNMCAKMLEEANPKEEQSDSELHDMVWSSGTVLGAGLDSGVSTILSFFLAMILNPEVQRKAQQELDDVVGKGKLPSIDDRPQLPYTRSILVEVMRWATVFPISIPHATNQDDIFDGMFIPKGSVVIPNVWHMLHDPASFPDPMAFQPERYNGLDTEMEKVTNLAFGFGRRSCAGKQFAEGTFFAMAVTLLATCHVLPGLDEKGKEVTPVCDFTPNTISFPEEFSIRLKARSREATSLLQDISPEVEQL